MQDQVPEPDHKRSPIAEELKIKKVTNSPQLIILIHLLLGGALVKNLRILRDISFNL